MPFDGIVMRALANELKQTLEGGRIDKIHMPEPAQLILTVNAGHEKHRLFLSSDGNAPRACLTEAEYANPQNPMPFCMLLRKHLQGSRIRRVSQVGSERILELYTDSFTELGFAVSHKLVFECMGKHSNILLVNLETGKIVDAIKHVTPDMSRVRPVLPGMVYELPPSQNKISLETALLPPEEGGAAGLDDLTPETAVSVLSGTVQGISKAFAEEIAARMGAHGTGVREELSPFSASVSPSPAVYTNAENVPKEFHAFPLSAFEDSLPPERILRFDSVSRAVEYFYEHKLSSNRMKQRSSDLLKQTEALIAKHELKEQKLQEELLDAENAERYRLFGELLTANLYAIPAGASEANVLNYYTNETIRIPLEPRFSPQANAKRYFKKYAKAKTAVKEKTAQLAETNDTLVYLRSVSSFVERADSPQEIEQIREELVEGGYLRKRKDNFRSSKSKLQPLRLTTGGGFVLLVGRNNTENDILTLKTAEKRDIWFHTKDVPGSHVILRIDTARDRVNAESENGAVVQGYDLGIPASDLFEAAAVAAYYSKGRSSENVAVDYCKARHVKKPAGAKPGMVIFTDNRTLYVNPSLPTAANPAAPETR